MSHELSRPARHRRDLGQSVVSLRRPFGCCARPAPRTPTSTWTVPSLAAVGVGLRRPAARDQTGRAGAGVVAGDHQDGQRAGVPPDWSPAGLAQREGSKTTGAWCLSRPLRPESVYWSGTGQPGCERSPHCLLTPPRRSCRLCARLRMLLRPGSRRAARDCPFHELVVDRPSRTSIEPVTKRAVRSMYRTAAASTHGDRCRDTRPCHRQEARCA